MTPQLAKELFKTGLCEIGVSIDYALGAEHDRQRSRPGIFDKAVAALEYLWAGRVKAEQRVRLMSVIMADNLDQIESLSQICRKIGVKHSITLCVCSRGRGEIPSDLKETILLLKDIQKRSPELLILPGFLAGFDEANRGLCRNGSNLMAIDPQGLLLRCLDKTDEPVGSLVTEELPFLLKKLKTLSQNEPCNSCWTSCRGIVEPLMYGPDRLGNWLYHLKAIKAEPLTTNPLATV
jgi:MoaA/NifB/PqqE/SkfB family radical SAM enzyme